VRRNVHEIQDSERCYQLSEIMGRSSHGERVSSDELAVRVEIERRHEVVTGLASKVDDVEFHRLLQEHSERCPCCGTPTGGQVVCPVCGVPQWIPTQKAS